MISSRQLSRSLLVGLAIALFGTVGLRAAVPFSVSIERPERTLDVAAFTTFEIHVMNVGGDSIRVRAIRVTNVLPDSTWSSSICSINTCYPPEIDTTALELIGPNGTTGFTVHVIAGRAYGDTATILVQVDSGPGTDSIVRMLTIVTATPPVKLFRVEPVELEKSVTVGETAEFFVWVYNQAGDTLEMSVSRAQDYYTGEGWESTLCVVDSCYPADVDRPRSVILDNDRATQFRLRVRAGSAGRGQIVLRFNTGRGTEPVEMRFTVNAGASSAPDVGERDGGRAFAFPNPTRGNVTIAIPNDFDARSNVDVVIIDLGGRIAGRATVEPRTSSGFRLLEVDFAAVPSGMYVVRIFNGHRTIDVPVSLVRQSQD